MQLVEQHCIRKSDPRYAIIDDAAFKSKNLYNAGLYEMRQAFIHEGKYLNYTEMDKRMQSSDAYKALPAKVAQKVLDQLDQAWQSFFEAITANREGFVPRLVNGRTLKAMNQWYNKRMKELKLCLPKADRERVTRQMEQITNTRNRQVNHYLHAASKRMIDFLVKEGVGTIIVGKNPLWKQEAGMGKRNNQNFVSIPHARFIDMLTYKASLVGIQVEIQEESYTSKASFLDLDPIPTYKPDDDTEYIFSGKRMGRRNRLYRTKDGKIICADVNGSYYILRKSKPDAFAHADAKGIAAYVVQPLRLAITV